MEQENNDLHFSLDSQFIPSPSAYLELERFLVKNCKGSTQNFKKFLADLIQNTRYTINFNAFRKFTRVIKKYVLNAKDPEVELMFSEFLVQQSSRYFPFWIRDNHLSTFRKYLRLMDGLKIRQPTSFQNQRELVIYLQCASYDEQWASKLMEKINNQTLVDKKNLSPKALKLNQFFSQFLVKHLGNWLPQLERLLVRSESNIEIWAETFSNLVALEGAEKSLENILKKAKNYFISFPEVSVSLMNALGTALKSSESFKIFIGFLGPLISNEHNSKKKLTYLRMTGGLLKAIQALEEKQREEANSYANELLGIFSASYIKFAEDDQFTVVAELLDRLLPLVSSPSQQIAKNMKILLKNQNKNILTCLALTLSVYQKEHIEGLAPVKEIYDHFKGQVGSIQKKIMANWQWFVHVVRFMAEATPEVLDELSGDLPIFKGSCLTLSRIEKRNLLFLLKLYYRYSRQEEEELPSYFFPTLCLLLEETKSPEEWKAVVLELETYDRLKIITQGVFPLLWNPCPDLKKNRNNHFNSLTMFVLSTLKEPLALLEQAEIPALLITCKACNVTWQKKFKFSPNDDFTKIDKSIETFWKASLFDPQNQEEEILPNSHHRLFQIGAEELLKVHITAQFSENLQQILKAKNFTKEFGYVAELEKATKKAVEDIYSSLQEQKDLLIERNFGKEEKPKAKKVYVNPLMLDTKMMSEEEVKIQKYRQHFEKMVSYFERYMSLAIANVNNTLFLKTLWGEHFRSLISVTQFPETRTPVYRLVRRSVEQSFKTLAKQSKEKHEKEQCRVFLKYSRFFGQFFCIRNSNITPSLKLMEKSAGFLRELLKFKFLSPLGDQLFNQKEQFLMVFVNDMCQEILENMEFDLNIKKLAVQFYHRCQKRASSFNNEERLYEYFLKNINILSSSQYVKGVLIRVMLSIPTEQYQLLFEDILSFVIATKVLILEVVNQLVWKHQAPYQPGFDEYIKLKILAQEKQKQQVSELSNQLIARHQAGNKDILGFNMKAFLKKNSKQTVEKLCVFIKEEMTGDQVGPIFEKFLSTFGELYDEGLDQQGLEVFPFFLDLNLETIPENLFGKIFELLVMKFTSNEQYASLSKLSMDVGISIIKYYSEKDLKHAQNLLKILEGFINKTKGVSNIIFLGVLAPYLQANKGLQAIEKRITELFRGHNETQQKAIAKCMPDLMSFFKEPLALVGSIFESMGKSNNQSQMGQAYLAVGLLKGTGHRETMEYLQKILVSEYEAKANKSEKMGRVCLLAAFVEIFGRFIEVRANRIIQLLISYMADSTEEVRNMAKRIVQTLVLKMSSFAVKNLLPQLLSGLERETNWRVKNSYIWILGIMANCSARQLQTSLPIIVPSLSTCLSNAHSEIRNKASEALNLIGETIKNPQISNSIDILIEALQNPFQKSDRALDILLKTRFSHFIDAPSLSIIVPIIDYCLRGRNSDLKAGACQVIGSIVELIQNPYDLLPYLKIISVGIRIALCDPLSEIRSIAAMAVGKISSKIGIENAEEYFQFILDLMQSPTSNTTERHGAAQAYSEIICSHDYEYFEESLNRIFDKLSEVRHSQKEGFILVFLYVPSIKKEEFEGFIREVNLNMYSFVADEDENIRNSAMQVEKVLINNYCLSHTDLLLDPLCEGIFEANWRKRNGALILIGELLNIIKSYMYNTRASDKTYAYYKALMAVYILKDDELEMPRATAHQVWNTYIENTPKTIKSGLRELVLMWVKFTHEANGVVFKNIGEFSSKYGENYFQQILVCLKELMTDSQLQKGVFDVLTEFVKRLHQQFMAKELYRDQVRDFFSSFIFRVEGPIRQALSTCLAIWVEKMREQKFFEELLCPQIDRMGQVGEEQEEYSQCLHLCRDLLHTSSQKVADRLIGKVMEKPLSEFKIEVITNNADRLANHLYSLFKQPATQVFVEEIYDLIELKEKQNRLELIVYCLEQVSLRLNPKYKVEFVRMLNRHLRKLVQGLPSTQKDLQIIKKLLGICFFFLSSVDLSELEELQILLGELSPLVFIEQSGIKELVHKIYQILISNPKEQKTPLYLKQMIVSLENKAQDLKISTIWEDRAITHNYINLLVKCIAYGNSETMEEALNMTTFLMNYAKRQLVDKQILRIVGPVIRAANYPLQLKQKLLLMEFLQSVYLKRFNIEVYSNQILSICFRLLQEHRERQEAMECVATQFQCLLIHSHNKSQLMLAIIHKIKQHGTILLQAVYFLVKGLVKQNVELPRTTYEKTYEEFNHIAIHNEDKLPLKGVYYASKTAARIGTKLQVHTNSLKKQLEAVTCPYEVVLNYLHFAYYKKMAVPRLKCIQIFIRESPREKVYYLLKSLKLCRKVSGETRDSYNEQYVKELVPETLSGFEDIIDILQEFEEQ